MSKKCGFAAILGRPNVGKSTLLNQILGEKIAATTPKPQTTRTRIRGIKTSEVAQIVFVDTPGVHRGKRALNRYMNEAALLAIPDSDVALIVIDAIDQDSRGDAIHRDDQLLFDGLRELEIPLIVVLNKVDRIEKPKLLPLIDRFAALEGVELIIPISARGGDGVPQLVEAVVERLPEGPFLYPDDQVTEETLRFLVAELVREQLFLCLAQELPYSTAVEIELYKELPEKKMTEIHAVVVVERENQKKIVIGKGGKTIKTIGTRARNEIEVMLEQKVFLSLFVRVEPKWTETDKGLKKLGYQ